jgi:predicted ATPase
MGRFLAAVAASGVQALVETHSDHLVNGIRLAAAERAGIAATDIVIHYFGAGTNQKIEVAETGSLTTWPGGFFDQGEKDLSALSRIARGR